MAIIETGSSTTGAANVDAEYNLKVTLPQVTTTGGVESPNFVGASRMFTENDPGTITGTSYLK
ncbi:hypothetical protein UFOVP1085_58, partial [uncultured Caudovirales phage]